MRPLAPHLASVRQRYFVRYLTAILLDLAVLGLFAEHWDHVVAQSFSVVFAAAVLLQVLLKLTLAAEERIGAHFAERPGRRAKVLRVLFTWLLLVGSKFGILAVVNFTFGEQLTFHGPFHGMVAFVLVIVAMLGAEAAVRWVYRRLG